MIKMRKFFVFIIFSLFVSLLFSQSSVRLSNDWTNTYIINPGSINDQYLSELNMAYRKQWVGFRGAPTTLFASGTLYLEDMHTQFGLKVMQDKIGFTSTTNAALTYGYSMMVNADWKLDMGLGLSYQSLAYDISKVSSPTPSDPIVLTKLLSQNFINSDLGAEFGNASWRFGVASQNVFSIFSQSKILFPNTNFLYGMYRTNNPDFFNVGYGICEVQYSNVYQTEFNLTGYFKAAPETTPFQIGLIYRTWSEVGALFGFNLNHNLRVSYNYDYNFNGLSKTSMGSHEVMITYRFDKNTGCKNCWY